MSRILIALLALVAGCVAVAGLPDDASAQKGVAFVVGTDKYDNLDKTRQLQRASTMHGRLARRSRRSASRWLLPRT